MIGFGEIFRSIIGIMKKLPVLLLCVLFLLSAAAVCAQTADQLITEVNTLRAAYGLAPYMVDASLMSLAQSHSDYQAGIGQTTHQRADGSGVPCRSENVCGGANISASYCVNQMWTDELHRYTMIGLSEGTVGAGLAQTDGKNYYTLMVNSSGEETGLAVLNSSGVVAGNDQAISAQIDRDSAPVQPGEYATCTPEPDGSVYHTVQMNETLWSIALSYGKTIAEIQQLNGMSEDEIDVTIGEKILIVYGGTPVADTATPTTTPLPSTNTPKPTSTVTPTLPPLATMTPTITMTPTAEPLIRDIAYFNTPGARKLGTVLVIVCGLGLLVTLYFGFIRKDQ